MSKKQLLNQKSQRFISMFFLRVFSLTFRSLMHFESFVCPISLFIFCLLVLPTIESQVLKSPTIAVGLSISSFSSDCFCFMYFGSPLSEPYSFIIVIFQWTDPFIKCIFLSLATIFVLLKILKKFFIEV